MTMRVSGVLLSVTLVACGASTHVATDGSTPMDASRDGSGGDSAIADAASDAGAGQDGGSGRCGELGKPCSGASDCGAGYTCDDLSKVCLPQSRPQCGGFAGTLCPSTGPYTECLYFAGADFGVCLTTGEQACACTELRSLFSCP